MPRVPCLRLLPHRRLVVLALSLVLFDASAATLAQGADALCPLGARDCARPRYNYSQCRRNDLLDFYVPGLPVADRATRAKLPVQIHAAAASSSDGEHYQLSGHVHLARGDQLLQAPSVDYTRGTTAYDAHGGVTY